MKSAKRSSAATFKVVRDEVGVLWDVYRVEFATNGEGRSDIFEDSFSTEPLAEAYVRGRLLDLKAAANTPLMEECEE